MDALNAKLSPLRLSFTYPLDEIPALFHLEEQDLNQPILDYYPGPCGFTAYMREKGKFVIAVDSIYDQNVETMRKMSAELEKNNLNTIEQNPEAFEWQSFQDLAHFKQAQKDNLRLFLEDYEIGVKNKHYLSQVPETHLPSFHLVLIKHYCFTKRFSEDLHTHLALIENLLRQANEIRIYPLLNDEGELSPLIGPLILACQKNLLGVEIREVPFVFQKRGNAILRIWKRACDLENKDKR